MKKFFGLLAVIALGLVIWQGVKDVPVTGDWQEQLAVASIAEFNGDLVTVKNIRNFRYEGKEEKIVQNNYYDKTYNLNEIKKVWYVVEPFNEDLALAHTLTSFEFNDGDFLSISIETRKTKTQEYNIFAGILRTYPLIYIAADERDVVMLRTNVRDHNVYVYPVKLGSPENARALLEDMLKKMTKLATTEPDWYNTITSNCTSMIAKHVNNIIPGRVPVWSWQLLFTADADKLAMRHGLLDTDLSIMEARKKYNVKEISQEVGDVPNYSQLIRQLED